ncbi:TIGR03862 family flavoprotein [Chitinilyticum piscinae]|uniref:TIGR03862 family flavoprotein n=1 Tax=Chitinilyticum piscinae TaxID=2866724 RepID=A0A8J7FFC8_9NEIS|nr:TIGR03862 family flavoprotein [Chitinilyticum piscinae]MBE9608358.1 TIGR03862 family flavoprotein [Chitinilyticum piscinae]
MPSARAPSHVAIIGAGPAGLMAAEVLAAAGIRVELFDAMPSPGRKFLLAGVGGMNITHSEALESLLDRYGSDGRAALEPAIRAFDPDALRAWIHGLGIETFVGSSGKVFPREMKAAPLLRAWLARLKQAGVTLHVRHRWLGWDAAGGLHFATPEGEISLHADATLLALGGGSWKKLGSDGAWQDLLAARGVAITPLAPANCGFDCGWGEFFADKYAGSALKNIAASVAGSPFRVGECVLTASGIEGNLVYAHARALREQLECDGHATLLLDLLPAFSHDKVLREVSTSRGAKSLSSFLQSKLNLGGAKLGLLYELLGKEAMQNPAALASAIKALPLPVVAARPLDEAISSAGGVRFAALDDNYMLQALPGVFCAGEMLDWEAPTGGYLLTACFATGRAAARGLLQYLASDTRQAGNS